MIDESTSEGVGKAGEIVLEEKSAADSEGVSDQSIQVVDILTNRPETRQFSTESEAGCSNEYGCIGVDEDLDADVVSVDDDKVADEKIDPVVSLTLDMRLDLKKINPEDQELHHQHLHLCRGSSTTLVTS